MAEFITLKHIKEAQSRGIKMLSETDRPVAVDDCQIILAFQYLCGVIREGRSLEEIIEGMKVYMGMAPRGFIGRRLGIGYRVAKDNSHLNGVAEPWNLDPFPLGKNVYTLDLNTVGLWRPVEQNEIVEGKTE